MIKTAFTGKGRLSLLLCLAGLLCIAAAPRARADEDKDPPTRVARISDLDGSVSLQPGGSGDWGAAAKNRPMTIGDKIWSDKDSRAELQTGQAAIHLGSMTALSFLNLDENVTQMRLAEGAINFRVRELREGDLYEVDTPNLAFTVKEAGAFRVDVNENGDATRVTVIRGEGQVTAGGKTYDIHPGEQAEFNGTEDNIQYSVTQAPAPDGLDKWAADRDLKEDNSTSAKYVSRDMPGYSDLDDHGTWSEQPDYGPVWYPSDVAVDWAPYSYGYWNWVGPWGWTWVDYDPWGFAPFHYGRWAFIGGRWGWCPGPFFGPPIYGPAFVGFFGGGFGFGVGWFPLGFGEPFFPWFHCRHEFFERINVRNTFIRNVNVLNVNNMRNTNFRFAHDPRAVSAASREGFTRGQMVNRGNFHFTQASLKGAQVTNRVNASPTRQSAFGAANSRTNVSRPPASVQNRTVMARTAPARGASQMRVRTMNTSHLTAGRVGNERGNFTSNRPANGNVQRPANNTFNGRAGNSNNAGMTARQRELAQARPPASMQNGSRAGSNPGSQRVTNGTRSWEAQGNTTDRGRAPAGSGNWNRPANTNGSNQSARVNRSDRPPYAGSGGPGNNSGARSNAPSYNNNRPANGGGNRSYEPQRNAPSYNNNRPSYSNQNQGNGRSYEPPQRNNNNRSYSSPRSSYPQQRSYSPPSRSYSPPSRSYSPPSRNYSAPRSYSAPSRSYSGGGGNYRSGGGGSSRGGGGGSRSGGGGSRGGGSSHGRH